MRTPAEILCNFHWIASREAARSSQGLGFLLAPVLRRNKIRALVNLRGRHPEFCWWRREVGLSARLGVAHFDAMLDSRLLPTRDMLAVLVDAFEKTPIPVLIKCSGGQDRASLAAAIYILVKSGWSAIGAANAQFARFPYGHFPKRSQGWLKEFPRYAEEAASGAPIGLWIRKSYDPEALASWLKANGMGESFAGVFSLPWKPNR